MTSSKLSACNGECTAENNLHKDILNDKNRLQPKTEKIFTCYNFIYITFYKTIFMITLCISKESYA